MSPNKGLWILVEFYIWTRLRRNNWSKLQIHVYYIECIVWLICHLIFCLLMRSWDILLQDCVCYLALWTNLISLCYQLVMALFYSKAICSVSLWSQCTLAIDTSTTISYEALLMCHSISHQINVIGYCYLKNHAFNLCGSISNILVFTVKICMIIISQLWPERWLLFTKRYYFF